MAGLKELAKKIAESKASGGGNFIKDGTGLLMVKMLKSDSDGYQGAKFVAELLVVESKSYEGAVDAAGKPIIADSPGSTVSFVQLFDKFPQTAFGNTKAFLLALSGDKEEEISSEEFADGTEAACGPQQPLKGMLIKYSTFRKPTKDKSKILVLPKWEHVPGQTAESIKAGRAKLDATAKTEEKKTA